MLTVINKNFIGRDWELVQFTFNQQHHLNNIKENWGQAFNFTMEAVIGAKQVL